VKVTAYFAAVRVRPDRAAIRDEWIERAISTPVRFLRVVLLSDGETVHNAFFDRRFEL